MKKISALACATLLAITFNANARDDRKMLSLQEALNAPAAQGKIDKDIKLFFGEQKHPKVARTIGEWSTNKKTNAFGKSDEEACNWVFLSAVMTLQDRARKEGGDAVINIESNYKNTVTSSDAEFMCGVGNVVAGVAFKGTVVKLAN
jgi:hypothetical protein